MKFQNNSCKVELSRKNNFIDVYVVDKNEAPVIDGIDYEIEILKSIESKQRWVKKVHFVRISNREEAEAKHQEVERLKMKAAELERRQQQESHEIGEIFRVNGISCEIWNILFGEWIPKTKNGIEERLRIYKEDSQGVAQIIERLSDIKSKTPNQEEINGLWARLREIEKFSIVEGEGTSEKTFMLQNGHLKVYARIHRMITKYIGESDDGYRPSGSIETTGWCWEWRSPTKEELETYNEKFLKLKDEYNEIRDKINQLMNFHEESKKIHIKEYMDNLPDRFKLLNWINYIRI
jgi:hypothetical protein